MRLAELLRLTALGIALLCWLDPPSTIAPPPPVHVDAALVRSSRDSRPASDAATLSVAEAARQMAGRLSDALGRAGFVRVHEVTSRDPLPCDAVQPCVVITEGAAVAVPVDRKGPLSFIRVGERLSPNVEVGRLSAPRAHASGQATAVVALSGAGMRGQVSRVRLYDGEAVVGEAAHEWTSDGQVSLDVPWWPLAEGSRILEARVSTDGVEERTTVDNTSSTAVDVTGERWRVALVERRPSWSSTFIRRALEGDDRFRVASRTDLAPRVNIATAPNTLGTAPLDEDRVVVVGAPDALTREDVSRLERFARQRGGAVVLVPDRALTGPVTRLLHHRWRERLEDAPTAAGPLRASEWLLASDVTPLDTVWAESRQGAAVVATPTGAGIVLVSGALDAWRHRGTEGAYERFWRATVAGLAMAVGSTVNLDIVGQQSGEAIARVVTRTTRDVEAWQVVATRTCDAGGSTPLRLWPSNAAGGFEGRVPIGLRTGCVIDVAIPGVGNAREQLIDGRGRSSLRWTPEEMDAIATRTGGLVIDDGDIGPLVQAWLDARGSDRRPEPRHPMRAWWWVVPFVLSLAGEWWLRRRAGLR